MKIITLFLAATSCLFVAGCAANKVDDAIDREPYINQDEFTGLLSLGEEFSSLRLDYALDTPSGKELQLDSCVTVNNTVGAEVEGSQYHLLQLMKVNCIAAKYYHGAIKVGAVQSFLPAMLDEQFIKSASSAVNS